MPLVSVENLGDVGLNTDVPAHELNPNIFTSITNARCHEKGISSIFNYSGESPFGVCTGAFSVLYLNSNGTRYLISGNSTTIAASDGSTTVNLDTGFSCTCANGWQFLGFQGNLISNNFADAPQYWYPPSGMTVGAGNPLPNWPSGYRAKVMRVFKNFLVALNIHIPAVGDYPQRVLWSTEAEPGTFPATWSVTDATEDAGQVELTDSNSPLVDCMPLGDVNMVYSEDRVYGMVFTATNNIFRFYTVSRDHGLLSANCVESFPGGHLCVTSGDVVIHDGSGQHKSIVSKVIRRDIFSRINIANKDYTFVAKQPQFNEIWICIPARAPESDGTYTCDLAYCWNWTTGTISKRILPNVNAATNGFPIVTYDGDYWDSDTNAWSANTQIWDSSDFSGNQEYLMMVGGQSSTLFVMDVFSISVNIPDFTAERTCLAVVKQKRDGNFEADTNIRKLVTECYPLVEILGAPATCVFYVGNQEVLKGPVTWDSGTSFQRASFTHLTGEDRGEYPVFADKLRIEPLLNTPLIGLKLSATFTLGQYAQVNFTGYSLNLEQAGSTW